MAWVLWLGVGSVVLAFGAVGLSMLGERRWAGEMQALQAGLEAGRVDGMPGAGARPTRYDAREINDLPAPVQRYFRAVLQDGQPLITAVTIDMAGSFNLSPTGEQWKPFTSRQRVVTRRPGFLWDAKIAMLPGLPVRVVDSYVVGQGLLRAAVLGLFTVADQRGDGDIAHGEFMRWFAEVLWYPTALLPSQGVRWEAVDEHAANATLVDGPLSLTLLFRFNEADLIAWFRAEARGAMVGDKIVMAPWEGIWSNYQWRDGVRVPLTGEVAWMRPEGRKPYFIGTVTAMAFEFSQ
ncbi:hypothetical protein BurJ1DRAFT_2126 [Burkholderiales bacterium JOSHI_001]|nr:hypothetical protein BurJ1DRAFT_2126 [Burkholderiales bacterium JOSHI_001]